MKCYSCTNDAVQECRRCGRLYCEEHGDELCAECLKPASALPSFVLYRGSLLALLLGTVVALWLLLKPPQEVSQSAPNIIQPTATTAAARTPAAAATPTGTPSAAVTATATATATSAAAQQYTIQAGDSLLDIASRFLPPGEAITDFAGRIAAANGLDPTDPVLQVGQTLQIPR